MKVLLSHAYYLEEDEREKQILKPYPPLGLLYIAAHLEKAGIDNQVFDSTFSNESALLKKITKEKPDVIGLYCNLMTKVNVVKLLKEIAKLDIETSVILGGPDIRYNVESYLHAGGDYLIIGEGEESTLELIQSLKNKKEDISEIQGIAYLKNGEIQRNKERTFIKNIDELSFPAYQKIDVSKYTELWKMKHGQSMLSMSSQRGCPYTCKWCSTAVYGQSYRRRSPSAVVDEMKHLHDNYKMDALWFVDDVFTISHKWLKEFVEMLKEKKIKIPYECISRADRLNQDVIDLLKESGCFRIWIGAESGSQKILDAMDRRVMAEQVRKSIHQAKKAGIEAGTFIMLGYPNETIGDINNTIEHLSEADPDQFTITLTYPIKGTDLYEEVQDIQTNEIDWSTQSDRDRDFKRTYSSGFYKHAIRRVFNEVKYRQAVKHNAPGMQRHKFRLKSALAAMQMKLTK